MSIKFTTESESLNKALRVVSIVSPSSTPQQRPGFLFTVGTDGLCWVYSRNGGHKARSSFPIQDVEGSGSFIYPADYVSGFGYASGPISFVCASENGENRVKCTWKSTVKDRVTFDPNSIIPFESEVEDVLKTQEPKLFNVKILQLAMKMGKSFLAKEKALQEVFKTMQIFGDDEDQELAKKANGYLISSNGKEAFYFHSDAFLGKSLAVTAKDLSLLEAFMNQSSGSLRVFKARDGVLVVNDSNDIVGWPYNTDTWKKFSYYAKNEPIVIRVYCPDVRYQLEFMQAELKSDGSKKINLHFDPTSKFLWFSVNSEGNKIKSSPLTVEVVGEIGPDVSREIVSSVNVEHMLHIFEDVKGAWVEFRIMVLAANPPQRPKDLYMFRTIDSFYLSDDGTIAGVAGNPDATEKVHECKVTRYTSGME